VPSRHNNRRRRTRKRGARPFGLLPAGRHGAASDRSPEPKEDSMQRRAPARTLAAAGVTAAAALSLLTGVAGASTFTVGTDVPPAGATPSDAQGCTAVGIMAQLSGTPSATFATQA